MIFSLASHTAGVLTVATHRNSITIFLSSAELRNCSTMSGVEDLMKQVEELKRRLREIEEEKEEMRRGWEEVEREEMRRGREEARVRGELRGREEARGGEYMMRASGAGGFASRAMGSAVHVSNKVRKTMI